LIKGSIPIAYSLYSYTSVENGQLDIRCTVATLNMDNKSKISNGIQSRLLKGSAIILLCKEEQSPKLQLFNNHSEILTIFYMSKMRGRILLAVDLGS
jgi:hypothetical protein